MNKLILKRFLFSGIFFLSTCKKKEVPITTFVDNVQANLTSEEPVKKANTCPLDLPLDRVKIIGYGTPLNPDKGCSEHLLILSLGDEVAVDANADTILKPAGGSFEYRNELNIFTGRDLGKFSMTLLCAGKDDIYKVTGIEIYNNDVILASFTNLDFTLGKKKQNYISKTLLTETDAYKQLLARPDCK